MNDVFFHLCPTVKPCKKEPPAKPESGWSWYGLHLMRYKCPNGFLFENETSDFWTSNCLSTRRWDPAEHPPCIRKHIGLKV